MDDFFGRYLFRFELDKYYPLRRIPLAMRIKLDRCGVKLTIRDWSRFSRPDREALLAMPCDSAAEVAAFGAQLRPLIAAAGGDPELSVPIDPRPPWSRADTVPASVQAYLEELSLAPPTLAQWAGLTELQRFALCKLTRAGHENKKLLPALEEFGLLDPAAAGNAIPGEERAG